MPVSKRDRAVIATAVDANRAALLLSRADAIRKRIVGNRVIELRRGLVVPGTPCLAAINGDDRALIADQQNNVAAVGIDPEILVIIAARRSAKSGPRLATVTRTHGHRAGHVKQIRVFGVDLRNGQVASADAPRGPRVISGLRPVVAAIV